MRRLDHSMIFIRRHQKRLLAITRDKALAHHQMVLAGGHGSRRRRTASNQDVAPIRNCHWRAGAPPGQD
jgi:hypothetical protein